MSLRQLKFKPKLKSIVPKVRNAVRCEPKEASDVPSISSQASSNSSDPSPKSSDNKSVLGGNNSVEKLLDEVQADSKIVTCNQVTLLPVENIDLTVEDKGFSDAIETGKNAKAIDEIHVIPQSDNDKEKCSNIDQDIFLSSNKGTTIIPSLRQLKCKPKLKPRVSRPSSKQGESLTKEVQDTYKDPFTPNELKNIKKNLVPPENDNPTVPSLGQSKYKSELSSSASWALSEICDSISKEISDNVKNVLTTDTKNELNISESSKTPEHNNPTIPSLGQSKYKSELSSSASWALSEICDSINKEISDNVKNVLTTETKNELNISESSKTPEHTTPIIPSLRQLKCKPQLSPRVSRPLKKIDNSISKDTSNNTKNLETAETTEEYNILENLKTPQPGTPIIPSLRPLKCQPELSLSLQQPSSEIGNVKSQEVSNNAENLQNTKIKGGLNIIKKLKTPEEELEFGPKPSSPVSQSSSNVLKSLTNEELISAKASQTTGKKKMPNLLKIRRNPEYVKNSLNTSSKNQNKIFGPGLPTEVSLNAFNESLEKLPFEPLNISSVNTILQTTKESLSTFPVRTGKTAKDSLNTHSVGIIINEVKNSLSSHSEKPTNDTLNILSARTKHRRRNSLNNSSLRYRHKEMDSLDVNSEAFKCEVMKYLKTLIARPKLQDHEFLSVMSARSKPVTKELLKSLSEITGRTADDSSNTYSISFKRKMRKYITDCINKYKEKKERKKAVREQTDISAITNSSYFNRKVKKYLKALMAGSDDEKDDFFDTPSTSADQATRELLSNFSVNTRPSEQGYLTPLEIKKNELNQFSMQKHGEHKLINAIFEHIEQPKTESLNTPSTSGSQPTKEFLSTLSLYSLSPSGSKRKTTEETTEIGEKCIKKNTDQDQSASAPEKETFKGRHVLPMRQPDFKPKIRIRPRELKPWGKYDDSKKVKNKCLDSDKKSNHKNTPNVKFGKSPLKTSKSGTSRSSAVKKKNDNSFLKPIDNLNTVNEKCQEASDSEPSCSLGTSLSNINPENLDSSSRTSDESSVRYAAIGNEYADDDEDINNILAAYSYDVPQRRNRKNNAVYGSKSIRSCHLGMPVKPKLTNRSKRPFASSTFGKMSYDAKQKFDEKFGAGKPDTAKLTMLDLIFFNPIGNPMPQEDNSSMLLQSTDNSLEMRDDSSETSTSSNCADNGNDQSNEDAPVPVPQLTITPDGKVVIAEESLIIEQSSGEITKNVQYVSVEKMKRRRLHNKGCRVVWTLAETIQFYKALNIVGSDFETMQTMFPQRSRANLKSKFKREEKIHGKLIDKVLSQPAEFNMEEFEKELELEATYKKAISTLGRNLQIKKKSTIQDHPALYYSKRKSSGDLSLKEIRQVLKECDEQEARKKEMHDHSFIDTEETVDQYADQASAERANTKKPTIKPLRTVGEVESAPQNTRFNDKEKENSGNKTDNIVISTNIAYDNVKYTQYVTYNPNNLKKPIEINATIAHETDDVLS